MMTGFSTTFVVSITLGWRRNSDAAAMTAATPTPPSRTALLQVSTIAAPPGVLLVPADAGERSVDMSRVNDVRLVDVEGHVLASLNGAEAEGFTERAVSIDDPARGRVDGHVDVLDDDALRAGHVDALLDDLLDRRGHFDGL